MNANDQATVLLTGVGEPAAIESIGLVPATRWRRFITGLIDSSIFMYLYGRVVEFNRWYDEQVVDLHMQCPACEIFESKGSAINAIFFGKYPERGEMIYEGMVIPNFFTDILPWWFVSMLLYYFISEVLFGSSIGKWIAGTRIVAENGEKSRILQRLVRTVARLIPFEPFSLLFSGKKRRGWHDSLSKTYVVRKR